MPKILCIVSLVISSIVFVLFVMNMMAGFPFGNVTGSTPANIGMIVTSLVVGVFSVLTFLEIR